ncbi:unnamed protein product, partial [Clonostachys byssicola]
PGVERTLGELHSIQKRYPSTPELLADLIYLRDYELTPTGRLVKDVLILENATAPCGPRYRHRIQGAETAWEPRVSQGNLLLKDKGGGGADGSFLFAGEIARSENRGLEEINNKVWEYYHMFHKYGAGMAVLIQVGANVAAVVCPQGSRIRTFVGRNDSHTPSPEDKTIDRGDLITLLGVHTLGQQRFEDNARAGDPHSTTPGVWSTNFYRETVKTDSAQREDIQVSQ